MDDLKTYRELIEQLNEPERSQAIYNITKQGYVNIMDKHKFIEGTTFISSTFVWRNTEQGVKYWFNIHQQILNNTYNYAGKKS